MAEKELTPIDIITKTFDLFPQEDRFVCSTVRGQSQIFIRKDVVLKAMLEFGEQSFNAAKEQEVTCFLNQDDTPACSIQAHFYTFKDYLKQLEDDNNNHDQRSKV